MSRMTFFFMTFLMTLLSLIFGVNPWPTIVKTIESQCRTAIVHGENIYRGACSDLNFDNYGMRCNNVACKRISPTANGHIEGYIGRAVDGTRCAEGKVCIGGQCVSLNGRRMPHQSGSNPRWVCKQVTGRG